MNVRLRQQGFWRHSVMLLVLVAALARGEASLASGGSHGGHGDSGHASSGHGAADHGGHGGHGGSHGEDAGDQHGSGIFLGEFRVRAYYPVEGHKSTATFVLHATVDGDHLAESQRLMPYRKHKVRDQVLLVTRLAPLVEFDEPELTGFRRRIVVQLRRVLPELSIDDVYVSDFKLHVDPIVP